MLPFVLQMKPKLLQKHSMRFEKQRNVRLPIRVGCCLLNAIQGGFLRETGAVGVAQGWATRGVF